MPAMTALPDEAPQMTWKACEERKTEEDREKERSMPHFVQNSLFEIGWGALALFFPLSLRAGPNELSLTLSLSLSLSLSLCLCLDGCHASLQRRGDCCCCCCCCWRRRGGGGSGRGHRRRRRWCDAFGRNERSCRRSLCVFFAQTEGRSPLGKWP